MTALSIHSSSGSDESENEAESLPRPLHLNLFEGIGIELEYMIVDRNQSAILPVCDRVLEAEAGEIVSDVEYDDISWSNELVLHVIELKTAGPAPRLEGLADRFDFHVQRINRHLKSLGARLMPTGMHPWMCPETDTHLWPHEYSPVYEAFGRIFGCRTHGWSNLQSLHINLPFAGDEQFGRLHAAIRLLLPILPAIAASSPVVDGCVTGILDNRLEAYRINCARIPRVTGRVIPEAVFTTRQYQEQILQPIYRDLAPHDSNGILHYEWVNARGAIARFDRDTIEIRLIDMQECPAADLAVAAAVMSVLKLIVAETWSSLSSQQAWPVPPLADLLEATIKNGDATRINNMEYLRSLGWPQNASCTAIELWRFLIEAVRARQPDALLFCERELEVLLERGPLARRILNTVGHRPSREELAATYRRLCDCLARGEMFEG